MIGSDPEPDSESEPAPLRSAFTDPAGRSLVLRIFSVTCGALAGFLATLNLTHGRSRLLFLACWAAWACVAFAIQPRLARLLAEADRRRLEIGTFFDLVLAGVLAVAGVVLLLVSASTDAAVVVFVLAGLFVGKAAVSRWQPSKDPADYR